ncbi:unnamed protein product [Danaus chrysippus]|uniref:(African queen) hypothetical protein n=1 Tax=Danaus chrysippus TaxID=151541 RepID=A0A8J2QGH5_9NEOP|nr:unnamed protein product [Danaus chrysippus]
MAPVLGRLGAGAGFTTFIMIAFCGATLIGAPWGWEPPPPARTTHSRINIRSVPHAAAAWWDSAHPSVGGSAYETSAHTDDGSGDPVGGASDMCRHSDMTYQERPRLEGEGRPYVSNM